MKLTALALCLFATACVTGEDLDFPQSKPINTDGKTDAVCGSQSCLPALCGYDCTTKGEQCTEACAASDGRASTFVAASVSGSVSSSFDSRSNPYMPVFSLDKVIVYGCAVWDYSDQSHDSLAINYEELIHASFAVDPDDPTRTKRNLTVVIPTFTGPGSYKANARFLESSEGMTFVGRELCTIDVAADAMTGLTG